MPSTTQHPASFFDTLFRTIWARVVSRLGVTNTRSLLEHARAETALQYPLIESVRIGDGGIILSSLQDAMQKNPRRFDTAIWAFIDTFTQVVSKLSGEVISREVQSAVRAKQRGHVFEEQLIRGGLHF
ncbi:MAG: hypothetical protein Q7S89_02155 [bacterium]|nr:hypothetical protein [bacterium]